MKNTMLILTLMVGFFFGCSPYNNLTSMEFDQIPYLYEVNYQKLDDGRNIAFIDEGDSEEVILFVHGLGSYLQAWNKNVSHLRGQYRCIAVDLPGYGKSSKEIHSGQMEFYADILHEFMDKLGIKSYTVAGHSMGGQIGIVMSLKYPANVKSLVLAAPAGFEQFHEGQKQWFRDVMTVDLVKLTTIHAIRNNLAANFYNMPDDAEFMVTDRIAMRGAKDFENYCYAVTRSVRGMVDQPVYDFLENIKCPVLILFGENDNLIPNPYLNAGFTIDIAKDGHSRIPNSRLVVIKDCGHFLQFEKPDVFNSEVMKFLQK